MFDFWAQRGPSPEKADALSAESFQGYLWNVCLVCLGGVRLEKRLKWYLEG